METKIGSENIAKSGKMVFQPAFLLQLIVRPCHTQSRRGPYILVSLLINDRVEMDV